MNWKGNKKQGIESDSTASGDSTTSGDITASGNG